MNRLAHHQGIHKFFTMLGLALYFSKPVMKHLVHIVDAMITKGFSGTLTDLHHGSFHPNHRTTLSHFFTKSPWEEEALLHKLQQTNRILYPDGVAVQAKQLARSIEPSDTHLVTVGEEHYRVYRYEGALNGLDHAVVLLARKGAGKFSFYFRGKRKKRQSFPFLSNKKE